MINSGHSLLHWNYFMALEQDLEKVSRFIEFATPNLSVYSIELAHILLSASSEVDVILKQICGVVDPSKKPNNINAYRRILKNKLPDIINESVYIDRYSMDFKPWETWDGDKNPDWWISYNNVKHKRDQHFKEASLQNTLNSVGALLITIIYYYREKLSFDVANRHSITSTIFFLKLESTFARLSPHYYKDGMFGYKDRCRH